MLGAGGVRLRPLCVDLVKTGLQGPKGEFLCAYEPMTLRPPDYTRSARADRSTHLQVDPAKERGE